MGGRPESSMTGDSSLREARASSPYSLFNMAQKIYSQRIVKLMNRWMVGDEGNPPEVDEVVIVNARRARVVVSNLALDLTTGAGKFIVCFLETPTTVNPVELSGPVDDYNAASLGLSDSDPVDTWNSDIGTDFMTKDNSSAVFSPSFEAAAFNGLGGVLIDQEVESDSGDIVWMDSDQAVQAFADKTGTFAVVFEPRGAMIFGNLLVGHGGDIDSPEEERFNVLTAGGPFHTTFVDSGGAQLETPTVGISLGVPQLFLWWRDGNRIEFRRNGVAKSGRSVVPTNDPQPAHTLRWFGRDVEQTAFRGIIARIIRWERVLSDQEQLDIEEELTGLYF